MLTYPYSTIRCNGRPVLVRDIINGTAGAQNDFEQALFTFIREWLGNADSFRMTTSGSTGNPKAIAVSRDQMIASATLTLQALQLHKGQSALICLSPEFIAGKMMIVRSLIAGMKIIAVNPAARPLDALTESIDFAAFVPLQVHDMLHGNNDSFRKVRQVLVGGGSLDAQDITRLKDLPCSFYATYGMTETVSHVALRKLNGPNATDYYQGMPGIAFEADDRGCLVIHWSALDAPVVTNDLVQLMDDVRFLWLGRWDNVINSGGKKIIPEKLESSIAIALQNAGFYERFFVAGIPDTRLGRKVVMIIEGNHINQKYNNLRSLLQSTLQSHEVPKEFYSCDHFTETQTGKVNRIATLEFAIHRNRSTD
jgi:O-succinylbenzoic acid--CoA ligase